MVRLLIFLGIIFLVGATANSYLSLSATPPQVTKLSPNITNNTIDLVQAGKDLASGNLLGAAGRIVPSIRIEFDIDVVNGGVMPVYLPSSEHIVILNGEPIALPFELGGIWIGAKSTYTVPVVLDIPLARIPGAALLIIVQGGLIDVQVESKINILVFSRTVQTQAARFNIVDSLESKVRRLLPY
ncbi:MAG: hypothetical protein ABID84_04435 [Chloroflexota bacterium]